MPCRQNEIVKDDSAFVQDFSVEPADILERRIMNLTPKEHAVFDVLIEGYTVRETAKKLKVAYRIVSTHIRAVYLKLQVNSQAKLIYKYRNFENGYHLKST